MQEKYNTEDWGKNYVLSFNKKVSIPIKTKKYNKTGAHFLNFRAQALL